MVQSKHSEEAILELGRKLIVELDLEYTVNTLARWMAHYLAELITNIEKTKSEEEKQKLKKECCDIIIQLWNIRERIPIEKPTERLKPIIGVLELFKERKHPFIPFLFPERQRDVNSKNWVEFLEIVKDNSERIYNKSLLSMISAKVLEKDNEWVEKHGEFLSEEEKKIVEYLNYINSKELRIQFIDSDDEEVKEKSDSEKFEQLFLDLENFIDEQKNALRSLKKELHKNKNYLK